MADDVHALAAAYAVDAVDPDERRRFEAHYPDCESCRTEVAGFRETVAHLGASVPAPLPAELKARVLAEVAETRQFPPITAPSARARRWPAALVAAAAAVVVVLALAGTFYARRGTPGTDAGRALTEVLGAPDTRTIELAGSSAGTLRVVYSLDEGKAVLVGAGLPDPGAGRTYQLWSVRGQTATSAGVFEPTSSGRVAAVVSTPSEPADIWGVTNEPAGGSPTATGAMLYQGAA